MSTTRATYDRLRAQLLEARRRTATAVEQLRIATSEHEDAVRAESELQERVDELAARIDRALSGAAFTPADPGTGPRFRDLRPSFQELLLAFPRNGTIDRAELQIAFPDLNEGAINSRVAKAKTAGLVEGAGWGRYTLTSDGRAAVDDHTSSSR